MKIKTLLVFLLLIPLSAMTCNAEEEELLNNTGQKNTAPIIYPNENDTNIMEDTQKKALFREKLKKRREQKKLEKAANEEKIKTLKE